VREPSASYSVFRRGGASQNSEENPTNNRSRESGSTVENPRRVSPRRDRPYLEQNERKKWVPYLKRKKKIIEERERTNRKVEGGK